MELSMGVVWRLRNGQGSALRSCLGRLLDALLPVCRILRPTHHHHFAMVRFSLSDLCDIFSSQLDP